MPVSPAPAELKTDEAEPVPLHLAYRVCEDIARTHYENFPVASRFIPAERRLGLAAIYAFARQADDVADAAAPSEDRLRALDAIEDAFLRALDGDPRGPVLTALADTVERHGLSAEPFLDLLGAFRLDARDATFRTWDDLLAYCRGSANPVGRLVLALYDIDDPQALEASDAVCTALQLTNFWQDLGPDLARGRLFLPLDDLNRFSLDPGGLTHASSRADLTRLLVHECRATRDLFSRGAPVVRATPALLSLHLRATIAGGRAILRAVERLGWRVLEKRPRLNGAARVGIALRALAGLGG
ncbi:MAG TPA: squalene synthase HpnC [Candidatus Limnocylindrales bacterium]|nr:squalene synthase HpnC [Candidatus Limnocylindrales bacterium]